MAQAGVGSSAIASSVVLRLHLCRCRTCHATSRLRPLPLPGHGNGAEGTVPLSSLEPTQYPQDFISRNVTPKHLLWYGALAFLKTIKVRLRGLKKSGPSASKPKTPASATLGLQADDMVRVRPKEEIMATLNEEHKNFGLTFESDMKQFCGSTHRVLRRVERVIDEGTGKMRAISRESPHPRRRHLRNRPRLPDAAVLHTRRLYLLAGSMAQARSACGVGRFIYWAADQPKSRANRYSRSVLSCAGRNRPRAPAADLRRGRNRSWR